MKNFIKNIFFIFINVFGVAAPLLGIVFFFIHIDIGLYICAAYSVLYALQRMPHGDFGPIIGVALDVVLALIFASSLHVGFWRFASFLVCGSDLFSQIKAGIVLIKYRSKIRKINEIRTDDISRFYGEEDYEEQERGKR